MSLGKSLRPLYVALAGVALLAALSCNSGNSPMPASQTPTLEATVSATPTTRRPENTPTSTPYATATATAVATPTATAVPPTPTATATATPRPPTPTPIAYTDEQLKQKLSGLEEILRTEEPALDADGKDYKGYAAKVKDIFEAGYYLTTGKTPQQHNIEVRLLTDSGIDAYIEQTKSSQSLKGFPAFLDTIFDLKTNQYKNILVINGTFPARAVVAATVHEGGHASAFVLNPKITGINLKSAAVMESQASAFEAAFYRTVNDFKGGGLFKYGQNEANVTYVTDRVKFLEEEVHAPLSLNTRHSVGRVLVWLRAREKGILKLGETLNAKEAYGLFLDMVTLPKDDADAEKFVDGLLSMSNPDLSFIREHALSRLTSNLPPEKEGTTYRREEALLRP